MSESIKFKRRNGTVWRWPTKLYVPVPLSVKNQFAELARLHGFSQAELGVIVVIHFLSNVEAYRGVIDQFKKIDPRARTEAVEHAAKVIRSADWKADNPGPVKEWENE